MIIVGLRHPSRIVLDLPSPLRKVASHRPQRNQETANQVCAIVHTTPVLKAGGSENKAHLPCESKLLSVDVALKIQRKLYEAHLQLSISNIILKINSRDENRTLRRRARARGGLFLR